MMMMCCTTPNKLDLELGKEAITYCIYSSLWHQKSMPMTSSFIVGTIRRTCQVVQSDWVRFRV